MKKDNITNPISARKLPRKALIKIKTLKREMSQMFDKQSKVLPFTSLTICNKEDIQYFDSLEEKKIILVEGLSKGKGYTGVMKRWNFSGGPASHGQKTKHRAPGSIGAQGQGRVIPGKKMAGRLGMEKVSFYTKFLGVDKEAAIVMVKGGVPGSRNSEVFLYVEKSIE